MQKDSVNYMLSGKLSLIKPIFAPMMVRLSFPPFFLKNEVLSIDIQTSYVLPLAFNIINDEQKEKAIKNLLETITRENTTDCGKLCPSYSLMTGFYRHCMDW